MRTPPPVYRMGRCRTCPRHCKPCLTVEEANAILKDETRRPWLGNDLCGECHKKSNRRSKRYWDGPQGDEEPEEANVEAMSLEELVAECERLQTELENIWSK